MPSICEERSASFLTYMETKSPMLGIRDDNPSSVAIFLLASISFVSSSPDTSIGGLGGRGAGRKDS